MTGEKNNQRPKQLLLTSKNNEEETTQQSTEKTNSEYQMEQPLSKFSMRYQQTPKEKELFKRLSIILSLLALAIFITLYFISPFSKVGKIIVSGVEKSDATSIVESSELKIGKSLWEQYFNRKDLSQEIIKVNPRVKSANIQLKNMNVLQIKVTEFETIGYVEKSGKQYEVLSNGKFLEEQTTEKIEGLPLLINFEEGENLTEFIQAYEQMADEIKDKIETIESLATKTNPFRIQFKMKDGNEVIGLSTTIADKMAFYDKIVAEMKEQGVIDMEASTSGVFSYPFKTEESSETENMTEPE